MPKRRALSKDSKPPEAIRGLVDRLIFRSDTFTVGRLRRTDGGPAGPRGVESGSPNDLDDEFGDAAEPQVTFAGPVIVDVGTPVILYGTWKEHPKYGMQFSATSTGCDAEMTADGLAAYLSKCPEFHGIGPAKADLIARAFGKDFDAVIDKHPERVAAAARVPLHVINDVREHWLKMRSTNAVKVALAAWGLTDHQMSRIVERFGGAAADMLRDNPYVLISMGEFTFHAADQIAMKLGIEKNFPPRVEAGIVYAAGQEVRNGNCWTERGALADEALKILVLDDMDCRERVVEVMNSLCETGQLREDWLWLGEGEAAAAFPAVSIPSIRDKERDLADWLRRGAEDGDERTADLDPELIADPADWERLTDGQRDGVRAALRKRITVITGAAGTGKTTAVKTLIPIWEAAGMKILICAPTGKAARRIAEVTEREAKTIHRLLGYNGQRWAHGAHDPLEADVLIVDEVSMIDSFLAWQLFSAVDLDRTTVVLLGDHNQLPPIGPGSMLRDLIRTRAASTVVLTEVKRSAGELALNCSAILSGSVPKSSAPRADGKAREWFVVDFRKDQEGVAGFIDYLCGRKLKDFGFDVARDVQILTPLRKGELGAAGINSRVQRIVQRGLGRDVSNPGVPRLTSGDAAYFLGDKVIQTRNNYEIGEEDVGIMNGTIGRVVEIDDSDEKNPRMTVEFDLQPPVRVGYRQKSEIIRDLDLAYALTVHKSQGSEFPCVVAVVCRAHLFMLHRGLLYTAATRAQKTLMLIGDEWSMKTAAVKVEADNRRTYLSYWLQDQEDEHGAAERTCR